MKPRAVPFALLLALPAFAEEPPAQEPPGIQDNSFLMEEAYNQELGVVQHISLFTRSFDSHDWAYTFTQEWPLRGLKHQLSYSVPVIGADGTGLGDLALNYRYQLAGSGEAGLACAPRLTLLVPTGDEHQGRGAGGLGLQTNVALSLTLGPRFTSHSNLGATLTPRAKDAAGDQARTWAVNAGQSLVWLASPRFNALVELVYARAQAVVGRDRTEAAESLFVSPGIRWAYNFANGLQIVPGIAVPIGIGPSSGDQSLLVYLSFEHPFKKTR